MDMELIHDMRLSLQLIQASGQVLGLSIADGEARGCLDMLMEGAAQLRRMLDAALSGPIPRTVEPMDIVDDVRTLCGLCSDYAARRGVGLEFASNVDALAMVADRDRLRRVMLNLIMNAIRFSPADGTVVARCMALGDFVELSVTDAGRGIEPERLPYIFLRGETDGGAGYGLPSAMDGARGMGGSLSARSSPGKGSTFTLRLPVRGKMVS